MRLRLIAGTLSLSLISLAGCCCGNGGGWFGGGGGYPAGGYAQSTYTPPAQYGVPPGNGAYANSTAAGAPMPQGNSTSLSESDHTTGGPTARTANASTVSGGMPTAE